jgi:hypothetical protein
MEKNFSHLLNINKLFVFNLTRILDLSGFLQEFYRFDLEKGSRDAPLDHILYLPCFIQLMH